MQKNKFTFSNYLKELKKSWIFLVVFFLIGCAGGAFFMLRKPTLYTSAAKISVFDSKIDNGSVASPYMQVAEYLASKKLLSEVDDDVELADIPSYTVVESARGVFVITVTDADSAKAQKYANLIQNDASSIFSSVLGDSNNYRVVTLEEATDATPTITNKTRAFMTIIAAFGALFIAAIIVFIKFDFASEK